MSKRNREINATSQAGQISRTEGMAFMREQIQQAYDLGHVKGFNDGLAAARLAQTLSDPEDAPRLQPDAK